MRRGLEPQIARLVADAVGIPVIASWRVPRHLSEAVTTGGADAALVASMVHYDYSIDAIKAAMRADGVAFGEAASRYPGVAGACPV